MSSYLTHMTVGAAGGVLLTSLAPGLVPGDPALMSVAVPALSALLALWPDIDHPEAWISRRVWPLFALGGAAGGYFYLTAASSGERLVGLAMAAVAGVLLGQAVLWLLRRLAGGHRGATHSLLAPALLLPASALLPWPYGVVPLLLAWGWLLHLVADAVTPAGWRPLEPFPGPTLRLPPALARNGEAVVLAAALSVLAAALGLHAAIAVAAGVSAAVVLSVRRVSRRSR